MPTHIKLIQRDGFTRRITFPSQPTWHTLAAKIGPLYAIPPENVSVVYIDAENDEVTLSTQEELDDFYQSSHQPGQAIKFIVQDLRSSRTESKVPPQTSGVNIRDTFGGEGFEIDDDWQPLPPFPGLGALFVPKHSGADSPHAFVEVVGSDAGTFPIQQEPNMDTPLQSIAGDRLSSSKGKEKAVTDDVSSTSSVFADHTPVKPPVHVFDHNSRDKGVIPPLVGLGPSSAAHSPPIRVPTESTPKVIEQGLADPETTAVNSAQTVPNPEDVDDPPLPSLESTTTPRTHPSLCNDVASLLTILTNVVNEHPELAGGFRNIIRNTATGTYWNAHREAISQAAEQLVQTTEEMRRATEEESGRRVADALGGVFQTLSQTLGTINSGPSGAPSPSRGGSSAQLPAEQLEPPATGNSTSFWYGASQTNSRRLHNPRGGPAHHPHTPFHNPWMRGRHPSGPTRGGWGSWMPPPPPMPPGGPHNPRHGPPPPPPPHPFPGSWEPEAAFPAGLNTVNDSSRAKPTPEESKAKVDAARLRYKAEKERYRQEREQRKKDRERKVHTIGGEISQNVPLSTTADPQESAPGPSSSQPATIVSNGRGDYPTIELVSVHRHHTHPGHGPSARRNMFEHSDVKSRTLNRISRRLGDMGFTENAYPDLPGKIKEQMPSSGVVSKEAEDDIVTTLLEGLLAMSPKPPAPNLNTKDTTVPGAWH